MHDFLCVYFCVQVISARRGEFETGFERGGQTREHAMLVKTAGVRKLVVVVNKMDDPTVGWEVERCANSTHSSLVCHVVFLTLPSLSFTCRYNEIQEKLTPYLKKVGFNPKTDIHYLPVSGLTGCNLKTVDNSLCPWYQ